MVTQQSVAGLLWLEISERLIIIAARCQLHDLESLGNRAKLCAVITEVVTLLRWRSQTPSFFSWAFSRYSSASFSLRSRFSRSSTFSRIDGDVCRPPTRGLSSPPIDDAPGELILATGSVDRRSSRFNFVHDLLFEFRFEFPSLLSYRSTPHSGLSYPPVEPIAPPSNSQISSPVMGRSPVALSRVTLLSLVHPKTFRRPS